MDGARVAPIAGMVAALAAVVALAYPFLAADAGVGVYYGSGAVNPLVGGILALVGVIVFAAGLEERTDPSFAAGVALALGLFAALILLVWAATVRVDAVLIAPGHRWVTAVAGLGVPVAALWYARALGLV